MGAKVIMFLGILGIVFGGISSLPKYPEIDSKQAFKKVTNQIISVVDQNSKKASFEYMDDTRKLLDMRKEFNDFTTKFSKCKKDTECLVDEYNNYMEDNVASSLRMLYRYRYVEDNYGKLGVFINDIFKELY